ncbi:MAG: NYN domain-containing protein [Thermoanaerobaculia bacterium]
MPWLIDAANLGGVLGGASGARNSQAILAALLPWARERKQVVVVFDGPESPGMATRLGGVEIIWSGNRSADDVIAKQIAALGKTAKSWTVITNDQSLTRRCRNHGAKVEPASIFAKRTTQSKQPPKSKAARSALAAADKPSPNAKETAHWREVFGAAGRTGKEEKTDREGKDQ